MTNNLKQLEVKVNNSNSDSIYVTGWSCMAGLGVTVESVKGNEWDFAVKEDLTVTTKKNGKYMGCKQYTKLEDVIAVINKTYKA